MPENNNETPQTTTITKINPLTSKKSFPSGKAKGKVMGTVNLRGWKKHDISCSHCHEARDMSLHPKSLWAFATLPPVCHKLPGSAGSAFQSTEKQGKGHDTAAKTFGRRQESCICLCSTSQLQMSFREISVTGDSSQTAAHELILQSLGTEVCLVQILL